MGFNVNFHAELNGHPGMADVTVTGDDKKIVTSDRIQASSWKERRRFSKWLAKRLNIAPEVVEAVVEPRWTEEVNRLAELKKAEAEAPPETPGSPGSPCSGEVYLVADGKICRKKFTREGAQVLEPLCNFKAQIVQQVLHDDGAERKVFLAIEGQLDTGQQLPRVEVPAERFAGMEWVIPSWGVAPVFRAGLGAKDHLRAALQILSGSVPSRTVYGHVGWRKLGDSWVYLHAGGAIGVAGLAGEVDVSLPGALGRYELPEPPTGEALTAAIKASLGLLEGLAPDCLTFPLLAAPYRAVLGDTDFALHLAGPSGVFKTELAALAQQHYGAGLSRANLPGSWTSTENALEGLAFAAKDALLTIDDFAPRGSAYEVQSYHRKADRVFRAQGNRSARQRLWADGRLRPERPPRGLVLSTGEEVPAGASVRARLFILELGPGDVTVARLTKCQRDAADGLYALAMTGFVRWLAPRLDEVRRELPDLQAKLRGKATQSGAHARTPGIVASLAAGLHYFSEFAREVGAITTAQRNQLTKRGWTALTKSAAAQTEHVHAADPCDTFVRLLLAVMASGRGHVADPTGVKPPPQAEAWGWEGQQAHHLDKDLVARPEVTYAPRGRRLGWVEGSNLYLEPEAAYAGAQELARDQGESLPVSAQTLRKRLKGRGLLASAEKDKTTIRRQLQGRERVVLHLHTGILLQKQGEQGGPGDTSCKSHAPEDFAPTDSAPCSADAPRSTGRQPPVGEADPGQQGGKPDDASPDGSSGCGDRPPVIPVIPVSTGGGSPAGADFTEEDL
jgi:hypothetical protein